MDFPWFTVSDFLADDLGKSHQVFHVRLSGAQLGHLRIFAHMEPPRSSEICENGDLTSCSMFFVCRAVDLLGTNGTILEP